MLLGWWRLGPEDREWTSLPSQLQEEMQSSDEPGEPHEPRYEPLLAVGIAPEHFLSAGGTRFVACASGRTMARMFPSTTARPTI